jgi:two-component system response regulator MprA
MSHDKNEFTVAHVPPPKPRILLVDDEKINRDSLGMVLRSNGFDVVTAADVTEALKQIGSQAFDALFD